MEIKIGVQHGPRELVLDSNDKPASLEDQVAKAVSEPGSLLVLQDVRGRTVIVPGDKIAYVAIGGGVSGHVGFRS